MFFSTIPSVSVAEAAEAAAQGAMLLDVRTPAEYAQGHARSAVNQPLSMLSPERIAALKEHERVLVMCQSGGRSSAATRALIAAGVKAVNVSGGTAAWAASGLPMV